MSWHDLWVDTSRPLAPVGMLHSPQSDSTEYSPKDMASPKERRMCDLAKKIADSHGLDNDVVDTLFSLGNEDVCDLVYHFGCLNHARHLSSVLSALLFMPADDEADREKESPERFEAVRGGIHEVTSRPDSCDWVAKARKIYARLVSQA